MSSSPSSQPEAVRALIETPSVEKPQLSPDGGWVLFLQRRADIAANLHHYSLWVADATGQTPPSCVYEEDPTTELFRSIEAAWSPDSTRIAIAAAGEIVISAPLNGASARRAAIPGVSEMSNLTWSPEGTQVAFISRPPAPKHRHESAVAIDLEKVFFRNVVENTVLDAQLAEPSGELWAVDIETLASSRVGEAPAGARGLHWHEGTPRPGQPEGAPRGVVDATGHWIAQPSAADWFSPPTVSEGAAADSTPPVAPQPDTLRLARLGWASDGSLLFATDWHMARHLFRMRPGEEAERVTPEGFTYDSFTAQGGRVAFVRENPVEPANVYVLSEADLLAGRFEPMQLTDIRSSIEPSPRFSVRSWESDGVTIEGYLVLPAEGVGSAPYPTLVDIQGGPTMVRISQWSHFPNALFASQGYAVFVPGSRGRFSGYDKEFCHHIETTGFQLRDPLRDVLAGVDDLISDGIADPDRVGISGHSYGAVLTSYAVTQTDRFRAASFHEGMVEQFRLLRLYGGSPESLAAMKHITGYGSPYDPDEAARIRQESPIDNLHTARIPTLIEAGEESLTYDALMFAHGLAHHGVPYELNLNPRTKHVVFEPKLFAEAIMRNLAWFDYWLRDAPYPNGERQKQFDEWKQKKVGPQAAG